MANNYQAPTNQISKVQTSKKLVALYDKLRPASINRYAQIHAKGEAADGSMKVTSLIQVRIQDYSAGTGQMSVNADFNLSPEQVQFIFSRIEAGWRDFEFRQDKIFGEPDQTGHSIAQSFQITRHDVDANGNPMRSPWQIKISNGKGIRVKNATGGYYMKGGSYIPEKNTFINLADADAYALFKRADSFIRAWEDVTAASLIAQGKTAYERSVAQYKESHRYGSSNGYPAGTIAAETPQYAQAPAAPSQAGSWQGNTAQPYNNMPQRQNNPVPRGGYVPVGGFVPQSGYVGGYVPQPGTVTQ